MSTAKTFSPKDKVNFGKYKGQRWEQLSVVYVDWLAKNINNESIKAQAQVELERRKTLK